ncbi:hypothetical protein M2480_000960 [Parabacteroides sp. PFB2-12]|uniref:caspase family protein n=1 Tax=unclassified Parabacteroides TaxID=2649774 RepID=UPI002475201B|nr:MULTISPECIES: caspase family protein [unclassified Parabacteroides]MDH6341583.1 hypothetical protein [Parabacteroides sp. PM6-13]MDH6389994.1 hypothetical protein [Parabacteroides sp. PFB2-12]
MAAIAVQAQQNGISAPIQFRLPVEMYVRNYVEPRLATWMKWDRYEESTVHYQERVSDENKKKKIQEWEQEALSIYKKKYAETVNWNQFQIMGAYDPDNESILLHSDSFGQFAINVPRGVSARSFVEQFDSLKVSDVDFYFSGNDIGLDRLTLVLPSSEFQYVYDSKQQHQYTELDIVYDPGPLETFAFDEVVRPAQLYDSNVILLGGSDVDVNIPQASRINDNTYVSIIGNENYFYESRTRFSANDARIFYEYCTQTLGIPAKNIFKKEDATYGDMLKSVQFLKDAARSKDGDIRVIFYYSGHGMSDIRENSMYLLPVDGSSMTLQAALKAESLYNDLAEMKTLSATVFLDACFSGKSSEGVLAALVDGAGIEITPKEESLNGNLVVFSATSEAEIAYPYEEKKHRLFTYFLLKKLQDSVGDIPYIDLANYLITNVKSHAFDVNKKTQTPKVQTSYNIVDEWKSWKLTE